MTIKDIDKMFSDDDKKINSMSLKEKYEYFKKFGYFPNVEFSKELLDNGIIDEYTHNVYVDLNNKVGKGTSSTNGTLSISAKSDEELDSIRTVVKSVSEKINSSNQTNMNIWSGLYEALYNCNKNSVSVYV